MYKEVFYRDPNTGKVSRHLMYEISANESLKKWPKEYFTKIPKDTDPDEVVDLRPPMPNPADLKDDSEAKGPPVEER